MLANLNDKQIILASKSPRRQELLKGLDLKFVVKTKDVNESYPSNMLPEEVPAFLAEKKAQAFQEELTANTILITSDTIVIQENEILEKPKSDDQAKEMIAKLSGKSHKVITGVCIQSTDKKVVFSDQTTVRFSTLTEEEIEYYVNLYKPFDKAGAYGVQEWIGHVAIEELIGSYYNVMGLPVHKVYKTLKDF